MSLAFLLLSLAVVAGVWLGAMHIDRASGIARPRWVAPLHGGLATAGLLALAYAMWGAPVSAKAVRFGAGGFGMGGLWLLAAAWVLGAGIALYGLRRRRAPPGLLIATHAAVAVAGATLLLAYAGLGG